MATSTENSLFKNLSYSDEIKTSIIISGGTIVFLKDNIIIASEVSEAQYRELLINTHVDKIDVLSLKRYGDVGTQYTQTKK